MKKGPYQGWYKLLNPQKFIPPIDVHMKSFDKKTGSVQYKSSLELKAFRYCDFNNKIYRWSCEPFNIKYIKPTDGKQHRYYVDLFVEYITGHKILIEIKPKSQTIPPKKPKSNSEKSKLNYQKSYQNYLINEAKWKAAEKFAEEQNMLFSILTDEYLK